MNFPTNADLECLPLGIHRVIFDVMDDDDDCLVSNELGALATQRIVEHWQKVWSQALTMVDDMLVDYEKETTTAELLSNPLNTLNAIIMLPEEGETIKFRFDLFIDVKTEHGSIVYGVEFADLIAESASPSF